MAINTSALNTAIEQFGEDMELTHDWVQGGASETVSLGGVSTPTIRNVVKQMLSGGGAIGFQTKAALDANRNYEANTLAFVGNDSTASNNGWYIKTGASGSGSWVASDFDPAPGDKAVMSRGTHNKSTISDFDAVLEPGVYRIRDYTDIQNMPLQSVGTLIVFTSDTSNTEYGIVQVYFVNDRFWHRQRWTQAWSAWIENLQPAIPNKPRNFTSAGHFTAPYDDFNTFPSGIYTATVSWSNAANYPEQVQWGTLLAFSSNQTNDSVLGRVQLMISAGQMAWRINWYNSTTWSDWFYTAIDVKTQISRGSFSVSNLPDFNDVLAPGTYLVENYTNIQHMPVQAVGTLEVSVGNIKNTSKGIVQRYTSGGMTYIRQRWTDAWSEWKIATPALPNRALLLSNANLLGTPPYDDFNTIPVGVYTSSTSWEIVNNYPEDIKYGTLLVISGNSLSDNMLGKTQVMFGNNGKISWRINWYNTTTWTDWQTIDPSDNVINPKFQYGSVSLFETIGVVGDSYASGEIYLAGASGGRDCYDLSWGQIIARRNGITCTNFSKGGLTTRSWLTDAKGKALLLSESAKNLYLLVLGINDVGKLGTSYIGSSSDIAESYENNGDTFWGNYSRIISIIKEHAPDAKIIMFKMAANSGASATFNEAIEDIAEYWNIPVVTQTDDSFFTSSFYTSNKVGGHPTGIMYSGMALAFERLISKCFVDNPAYFADYRG